MTQVKELNISITPRNKENLALKTMHIYLIKEKKSGNKGIVIPLSKEVLYLYPDKYGFPSIEYDTEHSIVKKNHTILSDITDRVRFNITIDGEL